MKNPIKTFKQLFSHTKTLQSITDSLDLENPDLLTYHKDPCLLNAWVNICIDILTRNVPRASFSLLKNGNKIVNGSLFELFKCPNCITNSYSLWEETTGWWFLEGEAFWWFGKDYSGGIPKNIYVLNPRRMCYDITTNKWYYQSDIEMIPRNC
jgi:hypothetical protein